MSQRGPGQQRSAFSFQTAYDQLAVEEGENTSSEEEEETPAPAPVPDVSTSSEPPVKLTKTAQRKAIKAARQEKQRVKAAARSGGLATPDAPGSRSASPGIPASPSTIKATTDTDITTESDNLPPIPTTTNTTAHASSDNPGSPPPIKPKTTTTASTTVNGSSSHAYPLSTKAATESPSVPPEAPLQRTIAPIIEPVAAKAKEVSSTLTAAAVKASEPIQATFSVAAEKAKDTLAKVPVPSVPSVQSAPAPVKAASTQVKATLTTVSEKEAEVKKKHANVLERTTWTFIMIGGFIGLLLMGHAYMICLVFFCQMLVYREVTALFSLPSMDKKTDGPGLPGGQESQNGRQGRDAWSKTLNWYFFAVTNYFLYGESIIYYFKHIVFVDAHLTTLANQHRFISFMLYTIGFVGFVSSLKRGYLKQQFGLFCWVHMTLLLIVVSSHFIVNNILEGLIWFWVPAFLVIGNDIFAYICGVTMGRTPLIALSPKKTVEGFVGALFCTILFGIGWGSYFARFDYMVCPVQNLGVSAFSSVSCTRNPVFLWRDAPLPAGLATFLSAVMGRSVTTMPYTTYQIHLFFLSCFASLVAPFGGFFASGFKRAFNIKDFGDSIPGHGGMTDRMDCQFLMGVFTYVYYTSLIRTHNVTVGAVLQTIVSGLSTDEQLQLLADLRRYLEGQGIAVPSVGV